MAGPAPGLRLGPDRFFFERYMRALLETRNRALKDAAETSWDYRPITRRNSVMEGKRIMGLWRFSSPMVVTVPP